MISPLGSFWVNKGKLLAFLKRCGKLVDCDKISKGGRRSIEIERKLRMRKRGRRVLGESYFDG